MDKSLLSDMKERLAERLENAEAGNGEREKCARQYEVFVNFLHLVSEGIPCREALQILAERTGIRVKTIRKDMGEIRKFLRFSVDWCIFIYNEDDIQMPSRAPPFKSFDLKPFF